MGRRGSPTTRWAEVAVATPSQNAPDDNRLPDNGTPSCVYVEGAGTVRVPDSRSTATAECVTSAEIVTATSSPSDLQPVLPNTVDTSLTWGQTAAIVRYCLWE